MHETIGYPNYFEHIRQIGVKDPLVKKLIDISNNKKTGDDSSNLVLIEGLWAYEKLVKSNATIEAFVFCPEFIKSEAELSIVNSVIGLADSSYTISQKTCERLSKQDSSDGFFLLCRLPQYDLEDLELKGNTLLVVLDGIEQGGNIGTIIRSVDGAGGNAIVLCRSRVHKNNPKLIKASMGACLTMPIVEAETNELIEWLKKNDFQITVTDLEATQNYFDIDYASRVAVIVGNEIHGISEAWRTQEAQRIIIPMLGTADSLNVGAAATLVVYEASMRQKGMLKRG